MHVVLNRTLQKSLIYPTPSLSLSLSASYNPQNMSLLLLCFTHTNSLSPSAISSPFSLPFPIKPPFPIRPSPTHTSIPSFFHYLQFYITIFFLSTYLPAISMPSSDSGESRRQQKPQNHAGPMAPPEQEQLPCPRCDSTNTKFCYYNNYNFSQPRHFCKSCRRYWTHGGTLRDIPVGGGSRKNAKRSRTAVSGTSSSAASAAPVTMVPVSAGHGGSVQFGGGVVLEGDHVKGNNVNVCGGSGSFTSLLSNPQGHAGFLALGGFGLGLGPGLDDVGFGMGRAAWPFPGMADGGNMGGAVAGPGVGNTWQFESGEGGFVGGECFSWPGLAISTTGNGLK